MLSEVSQAQGQRPHIFSHMWKLDLEDKCIINTLHLCMKIYNKMH
jgi:hypothetical protein